MFAYVMLFSSRITALPLEDLAWVDKAQRPTLVESVTESVAGRADSPA